jgi:hypothetical protein
MGNPAGGILVQNPAALTPGLPVGFDPNTGLIDSSNTTGETQNPIPGTAYGTVNVPGVAADSTSQQLSDLWNNYGSLIVAGGVAIVGLGLVSFMRGRR